jgi:hypothetical protein
MSFEGFFTNHVVKDFYTQPFELFSFCIGHFFGGENVDGDFGVVVDFKDRLEVELIDL